MKKTIAPILLLVLLAFSCGVPANFTIPYAGTNTGLESLIDLDGYYVSGFACDSGFYSVYMFYSGRLFTIATTSEVSDELIDCFVNGGKKTLCSYPLWGTYCLEKDTIRTQVIRPEGGGCVIFREYAILPDRSLVNVSDYVEPQHTSMAYMANYPSYRSNPCEKKACFFRTESKRDSTDCPFLKKGWFQKRQ